MATGRIGTTPVLTTRWSKAPAAGTTSLSGLDDNSVSLVYSVGYEAVYQNGVLLSRGNDYTATNGTTITLTTATVAGDIIEVFANQTIPLTDTYSQTVSDGRFIKNTLTTTTGDIIYASAANTPARLGIGSTGQVLTVSGGVPAWGSAGSITLVDYTPTYTNWTLGNGTAITKWYDASSTLFYLYIAITFGTTSTFPGGAVRISFPATIASDAGSALVFQGNIGKFVDVSAGRDYTCLVGGGSSTNFQWQLIDDPSYVTATTSAFENTIPVTIASGDQLFVQGWYRKA